MAGSKSDYLENKILDHILGGPDVTRPASVWLALFSAAPTDAGGGTELTGSGYARLEVNNNDANFPAAVGGSKINGATFLFTAASADWAEVVAWGMFDASVAGNLLYWGTLTTPRTIHNGDQGRFAAGDLSFTEE